MSTNASLLIAQPEVVAELRLGLLHEYISSTFAELRILTAFLRYARDKTPYTAASCVDAS